MKTMFPSSMKRADPVRSKRYLPRYARYSRAHPKSVSTKWKWSGVEFTPFSADTEVDCSSLRLTQQQCRAPNPRHRVPHRLSLPEGNPAIGQPAN